MGEVKLGLLEFGYYKKGFDSLTIINNVMDYIMKADLAGFSRFWLTEHHNYVSNSPWSVPEVLLPILLGITDKIKVGMAGVLINYHSPYRVALDHKLLNNLYHGRVDLGFANGSPPLNAARLLVQSNFRKRPENYYKNISIIHDFFYNEDVIANKQSLLVPPYGGIVPDMFLLSSFFSDSNIQKAVEFRLNFSKSLFHDTKSLTFEVDMINKYREKFFSKYGHLPQVNIALPFICAKTKKKAEVIALSNEGPIIVNTLLGPINYIHETLLEYQFKFQVDEFILYDKSFDQNIRLESLQLLSEKFKLIK